MNRKRMIIFPVIVILQLSALGFMIGKQEYTLSSGEKVLLKCAPVDPRSLFSGDYVILNYDITRIDFKKVPMKEGERRYFDNGETVYVALEKNVNDRFWNAAAASRDLAWLKRSYGTVILGRMGDYNNIRFGLEDYFVPQGEGKIIEEDLNKVYVEVSVTGDGSSAISKLFLNGKEVRFY